ncbi:hypothetical protein [Qipengyuania zhejiangensis]|nr:hypothetical protein [Qipengyuania sp. Z2]
MDKSSIKTDAAARPAWSPPQLERLGAIRDIAGAKGGSLLNGINTNRIPS